jgi:hypothetical protein
MQYTIYSIFAMSEHDHSGPKHMHYENFYCTLKRNRIHQANRRYLNQKITQKIIQGNSEQTSETLPCKLCIYVAFVALALALAVIIVDGRPGGSTSYSLPRCYASSPTAMSSETTAELAGLVHEWLRIDQVRMDKRVRWFDT